MKSYTYYIEFRMGHAETITVEAPSEQEARKSIKDTFRNVLLIELIKEGL